MKIIFYINVLSGGGAERVVANLASFLSKNNNVTIINSFETKDEYPVDASVKRVFIDNNSYKSRLKKNLVRISFLRKYIKREKPDICISFMAESNIRLLLSTFFLKTKVLISVRNDPKQEYSGLIGKIVAKFLLPFANACVFQTSEAKLWFPKRLQIKSKVIFNSVNPKFFDKNGDDRRGIVTCGRFVKQKNQIFLLRAYKKIVNDVADDLYIYGDGPLKEQLTNYVRENNLTNRVHFMGFCKDMDKEYCKYKVYVLPSLFEGMPNTLMEAMAMGLAPISMNCPCGGPKEMITNNVNGFLLEDYVEERLAEKIKMLLNDEELFKKISQNASLTAEELFSSEKINNEWESYIRFCVDGGN